jgi:hypothetical protein
MQTVKRDQIFIGLPLVQIAELKKSARPFLSTGKNVPMGSAEV